jgi:hypothetical protein
MPLQPVAPEQIYSVLYCRTGTVAAICSKTRAEAIAKIKGGMELLWIQPATPDHIRRYHEDQKRETQDSTGAQNSGLPTDGPFVA